MSSVANPIVHGAKKKTEKEILQEIVDELVEWMNKHDGSHPFSYDAPRRGRGGRKERQWRERYKIEFDRKYWTLKERYPRNFDYEDLHFWRCPGCLCGAPLDIINLPCGHT